MNRDPSDGADALYLLLFVASAWVCSALLREEDWLGSLVLATPFVLWTLSRGGFRLSG